MAFQFKNNGEEGKLLLCLLPQLKINIHVYAQLHGLFKRSWIWKGRMDLMKQEQLLTSLHLSLRAQTFEIPCVMKRCTQSSPIQCWSWQLPPGEAALLCEGS